MKKLVFLIVTSIIIYSSSFSQPCLPNGIEFTTQEEIDNFQSDYPNCTQIVGFVEINGDDITNLNGLNTITEIGEYFWILQNDLLINLIGLDNLSSVGGNIEIQSNNLLNSLEGLHNLETIGGYLTISNNPALSNLFGLNSLTSIEGNLMINGNPTLSALSGLDNLFQIGGDLAIMHNIILPDLDGLNNLTSTGCWLLLEGNLSLTSLSALENLTSINGAIDIINNPSLTNLSGIDNINHNTIESLYIEYNQILTTCDVKSICDFITSSTGLINIYDNAVGCNNQSEVKDACDASWIPDDDVVPQITIFPNPAKKEIFITTKDGIFINEISIYNQLGQKVLQQTGTTDKIDISTLKQTMYVIEIVSNDYRIREKLIIEK